MSTQALIQQALALPLDERVGLAEVLWESISEGLPVADQREAIGLAVKRDAELAAGTVAGRTHEEVMTAARRAIGCD